MRPDYLDQDPKATAWAVPPPPPPSYDVTRALRRAFEVADAVPPEWDQLLARIR